MGIVKADFDWISLLVVVVAGIIGLIKSGTKKTSGKPVHIPSEYRPGMQEEKTVEWLNDFDSKDEAAQQEYMEEIISGDYYKQPEEQPQEDSLIYTPVSEEAEREEEELKHFNLRQAIISSEILRRPEY